MTTDARLVAYLPNGASQGVLPTPTSWDGSSVLNDVGALNIEYGAYAARSSLLGQPLELAVETSTDGGVTYAERRNCRYLYLRDGRDPVQDTSWSASCVSYVKRLATALVPFTGLNANGQRVFTTQTVGAILNTLLTEAQARGALTGLTWDFTATLDSSGTAWGATQTIAFDAGKDFLGILQDWAELGTLDYSTQGRVIQVWRGNTLGGDKTTGVNPVALRKGRDFLDGPFTRTWENLADTALVQGDGTALVTRVNATAVKPWGVQETLVAAAGVTDVGTLQTIGDLALAQTGDRRTSYTNGLALDATDYDPLTDYEPGSYVYTDTTGGSPTAPSALSRVRVNQITLSYSAGQLTGSAVLNDRFTDTDVMLANRITKLLNGATPTTGGSPTPWGNDILPPAQVTGIGATSTSYVGGNGQRFGQIAVDWADVTTNNDGTTAGDLDHYEVWRRPAGGAFALLEYTTLSISNTSGYVPGTTWEFQVRAVDAVGNRGAFSSVVSVVASGDSVAPNAPSTPTVLSVKLGAALLKWDGKDSGGAAMPADFWYAEAHVSTTTGFTPVKGDATTLVDTMLTAAQFPVTGKTPGVYYVKLLAVDTSGNASVASAQGTYTIVTVQGTELSADAIDGKTITGAVMQTISGLGTAGVTGMKISQDTSAGIIQFWTGATGETPGYINPQPNALSPVPSVVFATGKLAATHTFPAILALTAGDADPDLVTGTNHLSSGASLPGCTIHGHVIVRGGIDVVGDSDIDGDFAVSGSLGVNGSLQFVGSNATKTRVSRFGSGHETGTANASGQFVVNHGMSQTPTAIVVTCEVAQWGYIVAKSSTTFTVQLRTAAGVNVASGTAVDFDWLAVAQ